MAQELRLLHGTHIPPAIIFIFVIHMLQIFWNRKTVTSCLHLSNVTNVDWRSFCSEITPIGVIVETDETLIVQRKHKRGRLLNQVWVFGGRNSDKKSFFVPLDKFDRSAETHIPLMEKICN